MPDISMCDGKDCLKKDLCYRHTATPTKYRQSFFLNPPFNKETQECDYYWPNNENNSNLRPRNKRTIST